MSIISCVNDTNSLSCFLFLQVSCPSWRVVLLVSLRTQSRHKQHFCESQRVILTICGIGNAPKTTWNYNSEIKKIKFLALMRIKKHTGHLWGQANTAYLSQGTLQFSKVVSILQTAAFAVNVVNFKPQLLHHFKVVVDDKSLGKLRI